MSVADLPQVTELFNSWPLAALLWGLFAIMGLFTWLRSGGRVSFYHSKDNHLLLTKKSDKSGTADEQVPFTEICREITPTKCRLNPFLFNGHLQTAYTAVKRDDGVPVYYKRRMFESDSPAFSGQFAIDFVVQPYEIPPDDDMRMDPEREYTLPSGLPVRTSFLSEDEFAALPSDDTKPMLVTLHGLSGGSHEIYLRQTIHPLVKDGSWEACVVNSRGCAQTKVTSGVLYNARATWDVRQTVKWLRKTFPNRPLFGIGFSLGGNILANYLGEEGENCELKAAVLCANPWNLELCSLALQRTWLGLNVYSKTMGANMKQLVEHHTEEISKNPRADIEAVRRAVYLHEFDQALQCPTWGYPTDGAYHRDASSTDSLMAIRIPFFAIQAEDDPITCREGLPFREIQHTPYGVMMTSSWGGHLGFFQLGTNERWFVKPANDFLRTMAKEIDLTSPFVVEKPNLLPGQIAQHHGSNKDPDTAPKPQFNAMRRKMEIPLH